jgi:c(7)-type cytochrome triheme protein
MVKKTKTQTGAKRRSISLLRLFEVFVFVVVVVFCGYAMVIGFSGSDIPQPEPEPLAPVESATGDFSRFPHSNDAHSRLPCLLCHNRTVGGTKMSFPGKSEHLPCAGCHAVQFSDPASPICTICHTNAQTGAMKRFPPLRDFGFKFDHSRHRRVDCATCHKSGVRGGAAESIPSGAAGHVTCFRCHSASAPAAMSSCNVCHVAGRLVRTSDWAPAFKKSFNHARHIGKRGQNCATCHSIKPGAVRGRQVSSPLVSMHFAPRPSLSCGGCHNGKKAFGPDDFTNCKRCHGQKTFKF